MFKKLLLLIVMLCCTSPLAHAATVTLAWDANTESDLAGYKLYYGDMPRAQEDYSQSVTIGNKDASTWELSLEPGVYYFAITAYDSSGNESAPSTELMTEVVSIDPPGKPGQPRLLP